MKLLLSVSFKLLKLQSRATEAAFKQFVRKTVKNLTRKLQLPEFVSQLVDLALQSFILFRHVVEVALDLTLAGVST